MPVSLGFERLVDQIDSSARSMLAAVEAAGFDAEVVTCPSWDGRALIAHQAMVHRWAVAHIRGTDPDEAPNQTTIRETVDDLGAYFGEGRALLLTALQEAPEDLSAMVFLNDAPPPKLFWARRQAHENTIHMVDALSATNGRVPSADSTAIDRDVALDGLDELLCGFFTRGRSKLFDGTEYDVVVAPTDASSRWRLHVAERMTVERGNDDASDTERDVRITGTAVELYLALWNRGDEVAVEGDDGLLERWRQAQRVRWS